MTVTPLRAVEAVLPTSEAVLYTVPPGTAAVIRRILLINDTGGNQPATINIAGQRAVGHRSVTANNDFDREVAIPMLAGETITGFAGAAGAVTAVVTGFLTPTAVVGTIGGGPPPQAANLVVSPSSVQRGQSVRLTGANYQAGETANLVIDGGGTLSPASAVASSSGGFVVNSVVSIGTTVGTRRVTATGATSAKSAFADLGVTTDAAPPPPPAQAATITFPNGNQVQRTVPFRIDGSGYAAGEIVNFSIPEDPAPSPFSVQANSSGAFSVQVTVPAGSRTRHRRVYGTGASSGRVGWNDIDVATASTIAGSAGWQISTWPEGWTGESGDGKFYNLDAFMTPEVDPSPAGVFYICEFWFPNGKTGYIGLQTGRGNPDTDQRAFHGAMWDSVGVQGNPAWPGTLRAQPHDELGSGHQLHGYYPWVTGHEYRCRLYVTGDLYNDGGQPRWWRYAIQDRTAGTPELWMGDIQVPAGWGNVNSGAVQGTEWFQGDVETCADFMPSKMLFRLEGNQGSTHPTFYSGGVISSEPCASRHRIQAVGISVRHELAYQP